MGDWFPAEGSGAYQMTGVPQEYASSSSGSTTGTLRRSFEKYWPRKKLLAPKIEWIEVLSSTEVRLYWTVPEEYKNHGIVITNFRAKYSCKDLDHKGKETKIKNDCEIPPTTSKDFYFTANLSLPKPYKWYKFKLIIIAKDNERSPESEPYEVSVNPESCKPLYSTYQDQHYAPRWKIIQDVLDRLPEGEGLKNKNKKIFRSLLDSKITIEGKTYGDEAATDPLSLVPITTVSNQRYHLENNDPVWASILDRLSFYDRLHSGPSTLEEDEQPALYKVPVKCCYSPTSFLPYMSSVGRSIFILPEDYTNDGLCDQPYRRMFFNWLDNRNKIKGPDYPPSHRDGKRTDHYDDNGFLRANKFPNSWLLQGYDIQNEVWSQEDNRAPTRIHLILANIDGSNTLCSCDAPKGVYLGMVPRWWVHLPNKIKCEFHEAVENKLILKNMGIWKNLRPGQLSIISDDQWSPLPPETDPFPSVGKLDGSAAFWRTKSAQERAQRYDRRCLPGADPLRIENEPDSIGANPLPTDNDANPLQTENDALSNWRLMEAALELDTDTSRTESATATSTATSDTGEDLISW